MRGEGTQAGGDGALDQRAGNGHRPHRQEIFQMEVQAHAEHEQDHADFGALGSDILIGDKAGRERTHENASQQVADDGREPEFLGDESQHQRGGQASRERQNQIQLVWHVRGHYRGSRISPKLFSRG